MSETLVTEVPPSIRVNLMGQVFGKLTVVGYGGRRQFGSSTNTTWVCLCKCGRCSIVTSGNLRSGGSSKCVQCGHLVTARSVRTHGKSGSRAYRTWRGMNKGVHLCEWNDFDKFIGAMGEPPKNSRLYLLDHSKPHGPDNTVWATLEQRRRLRAKYVLEKLGLTGEAEIVRLMGLSNERIRQLLNVAAGLCGRCGREKEPDCEIDYCRRCSEIESEYSKVGYRRKLAASKEPQKC